ncbi:hypothetical protein [Verrucomicrobium sp. BvORR034]|uniref:hypothetical protein n=1 Tax=Verrucomicrobium sp. BvORR034 TaxID=1396418 RepID=UPI00067857AF|nr:hypothetical protein [Verrucomicrobium sp. BvORR034]
MKPYSIISIGDKGGADLHGALQIAIAHMKVFEEDIKVSYLKKPNTSVSRLLRISRILNDVVRHGVRNPENRVQLLVLPEVSVPHAFAAFLTRWAREHQIGIICGLEHRVDGRGFAWNQLLAALPYRAGNGRKSCLPIRRLKQHYAPEERFILENNGLKVPTSSEHSRYQLFRWRGASFAVYNCYELASLEDRSIFKGRVDFIVCSEFNADVNYFANIVTSAARDLHCYVVQVNSSHFGDSRVVSPSRTEKLTPLHIKGGDNQTFLTMKLALKELRDHQRLGYGLQKDSKDFKCTPPGFNVASVEERIGLGG